MGSGDKNVDSLTLTGLNKPDNVLVILVVHCAVAGCLHRRHLSWSSQNYSVCHIFCSCWALHTHRLCPAVYDSAAKHSSGSFCHWSCCPGSVKPSCSSLSFLTPSRLWHRRLQVKHKPTTSGADHRQQKGYQDTTFW